MRRPWRIESPLGRRSPVPAPGKAPGRDNRTKNRRLDPAYGCVDWFEYEPEPKRAPAPEREPGDAGDREPRPIERHG